MNPHYVCHRKIVYQIENNSTVEKWRDRERKRDRDRNYVDLYDVYK